MRIKKLILKNFRQFENLELDFTDENGKVLDVVVFAGVNGSGKSTILNLISEVFSFISTYKSIADINLGADFLLFKVNEFQLHFTFYQNLAIRENPFLLKYGDIKKSNLVEFREFMLSLSNSGFNHWSGSGLIHLKERGLFNTYLTDNQFILNKVDFEIAEIEMLKEISSEIFKNKEKAPIEIILKIIKSINKAFQLLNINTKVIDIESERLVFSNGVKNDLTFDALSNGEKQLFFQIFTLHNLHLNNGILLIDEPEDAMHPTWQREILNVYKNIGENNQIFIATHSPHILSSVKPESLFVLNIDEGTGKIKAFNMAKEHKNTKGLDPNRILTEIMGAPLRDYETQQRIDHISVLIQSAMTAPNGNIETIEREVDELSIDLGRQDYNIMLFRNELMLLKRKKSQMASV
jgi:predicted ATP-dependent endonuclease of OLD family